jgi:hypothetical protein
VGGLGEQEALLGDVPVPLGALPPAVLSAVWPHWPLYPQDRGTAFDGAGQAGGPEPAAVGGGDGDGDGGGGGGRPPPRPWDAAAGAVRRVRLDDDGEVAALPYEQRRQLAEAGFLPEPVPDELAAEVRGRDADAWFRVMAEPGQARVWIPVLREYAAAMGVAPLPAAAAAARERRRRVEAELAAVADYRDALSVSAALHLTGAEWRTLYPHLDPRRVRDPPTRDRLGRVARRAARLERRLEAALAAELDELMLAVHPVARRVEAAFARGDRAEIDRLVRARGGRSLLGRLADHGLGMPFYLDEDGTGLVYDERLLEEPGPFQL